MARKPVPGAGEPEKTIYLVSHGWHAGIVVWRSDIPDAAWPILADFPDARYLEVGWGDEDFYKTPDPHLGLILKAALLPTASVLHVVGFGGAVQERFPYSEIIQIELSAAGFKKLSRSIAHLSIPLTIIFAKTDRYGFQRTSYGTTDLISWLRLGFRRGF
ncbi:DUF2459 domain-containing protein, partial [Thiolapillus sp.]